MSYDEMDYNTLEEIQNKKLVDLENVKHAIEKITEAINDLSDVEGDEITRIYNYLFQMRDDLDTEKNDLEYDIDEIENCMQVLEDTYDERKEREHEYWSTQFRPGEI